MTRICFIDTETTGLYEWAGHRPWEIAIIVRDPAMDESGAMREDVEHVFQLRVDLTTADPMGLRIGRYYERNEIDLRDSAEEVIYSCSDEPGDVWQGMTFAEACNLIATLTDGAHVVGKVPDFDARMLRALLADHNFAWTGHYHLIDVETLAVGYLSATTHGGIRGPAPSPFTPPWDSSALDVALGIEQDPSSLHTALGDARNARAVYDRILG